MDRRIFDWKKGQTTIFIILAILVIAGVAVYLLFFRGGVSQTNIPSEFEGAYGSFIVCVEDNLEMGIGTLESHGGYIYLPDFVGGSEYMPFSSQLDFLGVNVPYWYYVSGNNFDREQVPTKSFMEGELEEFLNERVPDCVPQDVLSDVSFSIGESEANVGIKNDEVQLGLKMDLVMAKGDSSVEVKSHEVVVESDLGRLYDDAVKVYEEEKENMFLENYTLDVLNLYAPVDGVEFSCASKVWDVYSVYDNVQEAVQENLGVVKVKGDSDDYFVVESLSNKISQNIDVDFLTSEDWSTTFEVEPSEGPLLVAEPLGDELGLGALGFCYVAYHFVYDYKYPVMVQLRSENTGEVFQFPVAVVIEGSNPRESLVGESSVLDLPNVCENANTEFAVSVVDSNANNVDADISFECFSQTCDIGSTENGVLEGVFPQCVNGYVVAQAEGYKDAEVVLSTVNEGSLTIFMEKVYEKEISLRVDSGIYSGEALVSFEDSEGNYQTILYPNQNSVKMSKGFYNISVSIYSNVSLDLGSVTEEYCIDVPRKISGVLGLTKEECYEVEVPAQFVSRALSGGGSVAYDFSESDLINSDEIVISAEEFPEPDSLSQIQQNYILLENKDLEVSLR